MRCRPDRTPPAPGVPCEPELTCDLPQSRKQVRLQTLESAIGGMCQDEALPTKHRLTQHLLRGPGEAVIRRQLRGIRCHATQLAADNRFAQASEEMLQEPMFRRECFILAHSTVGRLQGVETDLFAGLR